MGQMAMAVRPAVPAQERGCSNCEWGYLVSEGQGLCFHSGACPQVEGVGAEVDLERGRTCEFWQPGFYAWVLAMFGGAGWELEVEG